MNSPTPSEESPIVPQGSPASAGSAPPTPPRSDTDVSAVHATIVANDAVLRSIYDVQQAVPNVPVVPIAPRADAPVLDDLSQPIRRRIVLPILLFVATCASTYLVGATKGDPTRIFMPGFEWPHLLTHWQSGVEYMASLMGILFAHEMGHFIGTLIHRIPASLPYFIPVPISPFGTMGAVIGMEGRRANRRQLFDIGIAGPLAGLVVAIPIMIFGVKHVQAGTMPHHYDQPLAVRWLIQELRPDLVNSQLAFDPFFMAGWVGLLITGVNMMPISQLDGGHVIYALFRKRAHFVARMFLVAAIMSVLFFDIYTWTPMLILVILIGADHPPTSNDDVPLGPIRWALGLISLLIPLLCFPPRGIFSH